MPVISTSGEEDITIEELTRGQKAAATLKARYGDDFYKKNAKKAHQKWKENGRKPRGFAVMKEIDEQEFKANSARGGRISRRTKREN